MSDELSSALRELAASGRGPAPTTGAEVRRRAVSRRRRRHTAVAGGTAVVAAALAFGLTTALGGSDSERRPAPPAASTPAAPAVTVDLGQRTLTLRGRDLPVSSGSADNPTKPGRMTVVAKYRTKRLTSESVGFGGGEYDLSLSWVIELRGPDDRTTYIFAMTYDEQAPGKKDVTHGSIGLRGSDAKWLHGQLSPGSVVTVEGKAPAAATD
ncbi:L,D-transpeptidase [Streptomyces sp. E11-3]|uniref:L,D-transpeptidase n=1 Tax=Streptomyces sp. E11-3 TaxID=3110112 RepID=UPI00397FBEFA